ncbi:MAG: DUF881 domain-containing protein [Clostridiales bacterium]|nr:DUF881 domain-containing protein [Clostridiales bacterium]
MRGQHLPSREKLTNLKEASVRTLHASEKAVSRSFNEARLTASLAVGLLLVGFLLVAQWRGVATFTKSLERQSDQNLAIIIQELTGENNALRSEIGRLQLRLIESGQQAEDRTRVLNEAVKEMRAVRVISGIEAASGPGITVKIGDPDRVLLPQDFVRLVHELRAGGAEAIALNGKRICATTGISGSDGDIRVGDAEFSRQFEVRAIGDPGNLAQALELPGGLRSTLVTFPGVSVIVEQAEQIEVPAAPESAFTYARTSGDR